MALSIVHNVVATGADDPTKEINKAQWNDNHGLTGTLGVTNGGTGLATIADAAILITNSADTVTALTATGGQAVRRNAGNTAWEAFTPASAQNVFSTIAVSGQSNVVADSSTDTLTLVAGSNVTITTDAATDAITINSSLGSFTLAQLNTAVSDADVTSLAGTETLTNKRITQRVVSMADATSFTPTGDTADENTQANTQAVGTLTANAPSGTPTDGQKLILRIKSTNVQTFAWNAIYRGSTDLALPTASSGAAKTDYFGFIYNSADAKWDCVAKVMGF